MKHLFRILYNLQILRLFPQFYFHYRVRQYIKKGYVVIDIGANWGCYTRIFKSLGAFIYAVEPIPKFCDMLRKIKGVNVREYALGNEHKFITMGQWRNTSGAYCITNKGDIKAQMIRGSILFAALPFLEFIKIDVEGSELPIIEDMAELITKHKPIILIETNQIGRVLSYLPEYEIIEQRFNDYLIGV